MNDGSLSDEPNPRICHPECCKLGAPQTEVCGVSGTKDLLLFLTRAVTEPTYAQNLLPMPCQQKTRRSRSLDNGRTRIDIEVVHDQRHARPSVHRQVHRLRQKIVRIRRD